MGKVKDLLEAGGGKVPQEAMKRASVRKDGNNQVGSDQRKAKEQSGLDPKDIIGWIANKYNKADGWLLYALTPSEKKEFGKKGVYRSFSMTGGKIANTGIVKIDLVKGTHAWVDNDHYTETDKVKFEKLTAYDRVLIEKTDKAFKEFNIV